MQILDREEPMADVSEMLAFGKEALQHVRCFGAVIVGDVRKGRMPSDVVDRVHDDCGTTGVSPRKTASGGRVSAATQEYGTVPRIKRESDSATGDDGCGPTGARSRHTAGVAAQPQSS